ncbi:transposase [Fimbriiglobus ruber]|uniref:Mobile element protein n=1 Tax=Fimbriiglobus ruber TaxID=1908690 RepID=A0A225EE72_9BACT|nr:transposase [Fimbriiglobus ruber]OWK46685.1 Mobile element protein [Fimbriiglobus ruber]
MVAEVTSLVAKGGDVVTNQTSRGPHFSTRTGEPIVNVTLPVFDDYLLERFDAYVTSYQSVFTRSDQLQRFRAYLRGLLSTGERKNVEAIAAIADLSAAADTDLAQALQHFVSQSPWDVTRLLAFHRRSLARQLADPGAVWVVHDGVFPKKGRHSVGVQRQFARSVGRKLNCQIGVVVSQVGPAGYFPLAARLYLPSHWLRENPEAAEKNVPEPFRRHISKAEIALGLLDALRSEEGRPRAVVAEDGYASLSAFGEGLATRGIAAVSPDSPHAAAALSRTLTGFEWLKDALGLDHFEGRTWHGWHHHVGLVFAAYGFLASENLGLDSPPFAGR